jgi:hypothetical protein
MENLENLEGTNENPECCRRSFGASIRDTAARLLADPTIAPRQVAKDRLAICESNVCGAFNERGSTCERCGCYMPLKTTMANMRCPIDHWTEWRRSDSDSDGTR